MKKIVLLVFCVIVIVTGTFVVKNFYVKKDDNNNVMSQEVMQEENTEIAVENKTVKMTVAGDVICHNTNFFDAYNPDTDSYDFSYTFENIKKYFEDCDIAIGTLETNFAGKSVGYSNYPLFNSPEQLATDLKELGFDILATANNHCLDKGYNGLVNTLNELDKNGIEHMGTYTSEESSKEYLIKDINGIKFAFLNYTYGTNGISIPAGREYAVNLIDKDKIKTDLENVKSQNVDVICVNMHWGEEYRLKPTDEQIELGDFLFENGVDIILGSHTHCLEPMEKRTVTLDDGSTKDGFIIYSLGNFMSGQNADHTRQSVILNLDITKNGENGKISIDNIEYVPIYMYNYYTSKSAHRFKILDMEEEIAKYEAGDTSLGSTMYNTLKNELEEVKNILGEEFTN